MVVNECSYDQSYDGRKSGLPERVEVRARLERRRRWSSAAKLAIIRETLMAGSTAQAVADRHEICISLIYTWRKQMLRAAMASFAAVEIKPDVQKVLPGSAEGSAGFGRARRCAAAARTIVTTAIGCLIERHARQDRGRAAVRGAAAFRVRRGRPGSAAHSDSAGGPMMLPPATRVYLACGFTGMRRGFDGLAAQVQTVLSLDPYGGALFVFWGRRGDLLKALHWDGQGLCLYAKRLELPRARFVWPQTDSGTVAMTAAQVSMLLEGIDWRMPAWTARP